MAKLYFYYSAMNAGKTTTLLQSAHNYHERGMRTLILTPRLDDRYGEGVVASRIGLKARGLIFGPADDLHAMVAASIERDGALHCVLVDESQFLSKLQVWQLTEIVDRLKVPVLAYGLRTDFRGDLFEGSAHLLVLLAVGQMNAFPWIEADSGIDFTPQGLPVLDPLTLQSSLPHVFFGGDAAFGPRNIITAVAQGHEAAISIDLFCQGEALHERPAPQVDFAGQKMGVHDWLYHNQVAETERQAVPMVSKAKTLKDRLLEVELGFDRQVGQAESLRCLNCDVQTVFRADLCIECDACVDACPESCINFIDNGSEEEVRSRLKAPATNLAQSLYVAGPLATGRMMVKDENVCLHCGICAERCPTSAWEMQKFLYQSAQAGQL